MAGIDKQSRVTSEEEIAFEWAESFLPEENKGVLELNLTSVRRLETAILSQGMDSDRRKRLRRLGDHGKRILNEIARNVQNGTIPRDVAASIFRDEEDAMARELEGMGGSTREKIRSTLEKWTPDEFERYWFRKAFDDIEEILFKDDIFPLLPCDPEEAVVLDVGCGPGRSLAIWLNAVRNKRGKHNASAAEIAARNLYGIDFMGQFILAARRELSKRGATLQHIVPGDFYRLHECLGEKGIDLRGKANVILSMMHTPFYCTTARALRRFFRNCEGALAPGGLLVFDTVGIFYPCGIPPDDVVRNNEDTFNFYDVLTRIYRERYDLPETMGDAANTPLMRFHIEDNTTGQGFHPREVLHTRYIEWILHTMHSRLRLVNTDERDARRVRMSAISPDEQKVLGMEWIRQNNIEMWLRHELAYRLLLRERNRAIRPYYSLSAQERSDPTLQELMTAKIMSDEVTRELERTAGHLVKGYTQRYFIYRKEEAAQTESGI